MKARFVSLIAHLLSLLPLRLNRALGASIARMAYLLRTRERRITKVNIALCYPDKSDSEQAEMVYQSLLHTGRQLTECAWIWNRPASTTHGLIREIKGEQLLREALASSRGLILVSPHIGNWELCSLELSRSAPFTYFYRSPRNQALEPLLMKWRAHLGGQPASLDSAGIRAGLRILKKGGTVGILPDQEPDRENGVFAPFFNHPALTMTLLPRLATRSNAQVIFTVSERLPGAQGWRLHYLPADTTAYHDQPVESATAVNKNVERCIAICPEQYLWSYKRFDTPEDGTAQQYS